MAFTTATTDGGRFVIRVKRVAADDLHEDGSERTFDRRQ